MSTSKKYELLRAETSISEKIILKTASKRALAQKNYALMLLKKTGDLESMISI